MRTTWGWGFRTLSIGHPCPSFSGWGQNPHSKAVPPPGEANEGGGIGRGWGFRPRDPHIRWALASSTSRPRWQHPETILDSYFCLCLCHTFAVPAGSDVRVDETSYTNGNPQWSTIASIRGIVATGSQLSQTVETMHVELTAAVSLAAAETQTSVTSSLAAMTGELEDGLSIAATARSTAAAEQSTTIQAAATSALEAIAATRGQCRSDLQEVAAQFNRSLAAKDVEIQHLVSVLA